MNILKIYRDCNTAIFQMKEFAEVNPGSKYRMKDCRVTLYNGVEVHFGYARSEEDLVKYRGWEYQVLEIHTPLSDECVSWLVSRVRG